MPFPDPRSLAPCTLTPFPGEAGIKNIVKQKYGEAALRVNPEAVPAAARQPARVAAIPSPRISTTPRRRGRFLKRPCWPRWAAAIPRRWPQLNPGEIVLDLGSGGGIDVLLSARRVGPTGKAYGLDMTDEMLALANENKRRAGIANVNS